MFRCISQCSRSLMDVMIYRWKYNSIDDSSTVALWYFLMITLQFKRSNLYLHTTKKTNIPTMRTCSKIPNSVALIFAINFKNMSHFPFLFFSINDTIEKQIYMFQWSWKRVLLHGIMCITWNNHPSLIIFNSLTAIFMGQ